MPLSDYMAACLTDPEDGYYTKARPLGREGDFITSPEISQVFGELLGLALADYWDRSGRPARLCLAELGPGRGTLMADILRAARIVPGFFEAAEIHLVEVGERLAADQAAALRDSGKSPRWHAALDDLPGGLPLFLVANEFFDALPIRQFVRLEGGWRERLVGLDAQTGELAFRLGEAADPPTLDAPKGSVAEIAGPAREAVRALAKRLAAEGGIALIVDYGHEGGAFGDSFQAVRGHAYADPFAEPGLADLTAHVDFSALARAAGEAGAWSWGPVSQGTLLGRLGIAERVRRLVAGKPPEAAREIETAANRLVSPDRMGALFKALALTRPEAPPPAGFGPAPARVETAAAAAGR